MKCVTIHLSLHNEVLERGELSPAGTGQHGHGHHSGDQEGGWQHKNIVSAHGLSSINKTEMY